MSNVINLAQRRCEREQRRISPLLKRAEEMRRGARLLLVEAEALEMEACGLVDYDTMAGEKVAGLEALRHA
jgi:hypothetical protein